MLLGDIEVWHSSRTAVSMGPPPNAVSNIRAVTPLRSAPPATRPIPDDGPVRILRQVSAVLDNAGLAYCVLHGYDRFDAKLTSDVDCALDPAVTQKALLHLLHRNRQRIGADVVRAMGLHITLAGVKAGGAPCILELDFAAGQGVEGIAFYGADEVLARRRHRWFWIPAPDTEFGAYLTRTIALGRLDAARGKSLSHMFGQDPAACEVEVGRHWRGDAANAIIAAARTGAWLPVLQNQSALRTQLRAQAIRRQPSSYLKSHIAGFMSRVERLWRPPGMSAVVLGPDGAGKSSLIEALSVSATPVFNRAACWGFAPPIRRLLGRGATPTNTPHALAPRPLSQSLLRAGYWLALSLVDRVRLRTALAGSTLVLYDRHFIDIFVDPVRYRYGGPRWAIELVWRLLPKPDLVILLDAPAEIVQARKREVPAAVTERQLKDYRALIETMPNGRIVDAARPPDEVAVEAMRLVHAHLARRLAARAFPRDLF